MITRGLCEARAVPEETRASTTRILAGAIWSWSSDDHPHPAWNSLAARVACTVPMATSLLRMRDNTQERFILSYMYLWLCSFQFVHVASFYFLISNYDKCLISEIFYKDQIFRLANYVTKSSWSGRCRTAYAWNHTLQNGWVANVLSGNDTISDTRNVLLHPFNVIRIRCRIRAISAKLSYIMHTTGQWIVDINIRYQSVYILLCAVEIVRLALHNRLQLQKKNTQWILASFLQLGQTYPITAICYSFCHNFFTQWPTLCPYTIEGWERSQCLLQ